MDLFILVLFVCLFLSCHSGITIANWNLSKDDDLEIERQLKLLNKPAVKTIKTWYGDLCDCVDFFKQPAFDHPLLKNLTSDSQVVPPSILKTIKTGRSENINKVHNILFKGVECPIGTVPITRVTKDDLIREMLSSKASVNEIGQIEWAVVRTQGTKNKYTGSEAFLSIHNPHVTGMQSSLARMKIANGAEIIKAGWRVDKFLHKGDNRTRFFVHTKAGTTNCFNTLCPGFVVVNHKSPISYILPKTSQRGGPIYEIEVFILQDEHGNWNLYVGPIKLFVGYWPSRLFNRLSEFASLLEWGGEIYAAPGESIPPMGSGGAYLKQNTNFDAYFKQVKAVRRSTITDAENLESSHTSHYHIEDEGIVDKDNFKHLVLYTGAGNT